MMNVIPWNDAAVLVRTASKRGSETIRTIEDEGTLCEIISRLKRRTDKKLNAFTIKLPDRNVRPFAYAGEAILILIGASPSAGR